VHNLSRLSRQLNQLADEISRRPDRLFTGVKPLPEPAAAPARDSARP
jgi:hypothetical protein